jgi:TIR domain
VGGVKATAALSESRVKLIAGWSARCDKISREMSRTKLFISYSHRDDDWLERLKLHLAPLERLKIVHVWSDTRIRVGDRWEVEIESALAESSAAVLMITPAFLASDYIWNQEMPHILKHRLAGMLVFPLITKPCAWRIATELAELQARPVNGRALSLSTDPAVDSHLADFVYELAGLLGRMPSSVASDEVDSIRRHGGSDAMDSRSLLLPSEDLSRDDAWLKLGHAWTGVYRPTNRRMRLIVRSVEKSGVLRGEIEYPDEGTKTKVEGKILAKSDIDIDAQLIAIMGAEPLIQRGISFREVAEIKNGSKSVNREGEYRAVVTGLRMVGCWISSGIAPKPFEFRCDER